MATTTIQGLYADLVNKAGACAEALNEGKSSDEVKNLKKVAADALDRYNAEAAKKANLEWAEAGDVVANALNKELAGNVNFMYEIDDAARAFEFSKDADPASNKSVTKALQQCVDGILYIPTNDAKGNEVNTIKVLGKHWTYTGSRLA